MAAEGHDALSGMTLGVPAPRRRTLVELKHVARIESETPSGFARRSTAAKVSRTVTGTVASVLSAIRSTTNSRTVAESLVRPRSTVPGKVSGGCPSKHGPCGSSVSV